MKTLYGQSTWMLKIWTSHSKTIGLNIELVPHCCNSSPSFHSFLKCGCGDWNLFSLKSTRGWVLMSDGKAWCTTVNPVHPKGAQCSWNQSSVHDTLVLTHKPCLYGVHFVYRSWVSKRGNHKAAESKDWGRTKCLCAGHVSLYVNVYFTEMTGTCFYSIFNMAMTVCSQRSCWVKGKCIKHSGKNSY